MLFNAINWLSHKCSHKKRVVNVQVGGGLVVQPTPCFAKIN